MPIEVEDLWYSYGGVDAVRGVSLRIADGEAVAVVGATGSGKTTLVQHFDALLKPQRGRVVVDGIDTGARRADLRAVRRRVGLVFQMPEYQLFEETVEADIAFGPKNFGASDAEARAAARQAKAKVGLPAELATRSPFSLSGGQMRRVAIAGVLAMRPRHLVLDEPTAGLDPQGREELLARLVALRRDGTTLVLVTHRMEEAARMDRVVVMAGGRVVADEPPRQLFARAEELARWALRAPEPARLLALLGLDAAVLTAEEACARILRAVRTA
jgi:energy-coupling factor transport system ATP-binding protein